MKIVISYQSEQPIYQQIAMQIKNAVLCGELLEGTALPSIRALAKELKISVITTKKAYEMLEEEGMIVSAQGKGSYVAPQNQEVLKEIRLKKVEDALSGALKTARDMHVSRDEVEEILRFLYEDYEE
ncbi:GntR family transcriptional regulator [Ructibacterium gallinarum]|uniref:GntR family transcriptional regulator n=1 Tax=Ructibacterium gallinarum TaxID=2779355 RepID=A0A9D5M2S0_9FIRM|nr:GntR family transcriptional regulator [Ructibacterium gallinarum]MBE5040433.1 GntR family transcriptional regulator [Ructibacterium gallinarum]